MKSGEPSQPVRQQQSLATIEERLLEQVETFGMTTRLAWKNSQLLREFEEADIVRSLRQLTKRRILESHPLHHGRFYFVFTNHAAQSQQCETAGGPFSECNKLKAYAKLLTNILHLPNAVPVSRPHVSDIFGDYATGLPNVLMADKHQCYVYWMRIDAAILARPERIAQQLRGDVFRIVKLESCRRLIRDKRFELLLVTCTKLRNEAILKQFRTYDRVGATPIRSIVIPELLPLLTSFPVGGAMQRQGL